MTQSGAAGTFELGRTAIRASRLILGSTLFGAPGGSDQTQSHRTIAAALGAGVTMIDTANIYADTRSETIIGNYFAKNGGGADALIATKFGFRPVDGIGGTSPRAVISSVEASLRRLRRDRVDLLYCHTWHSPPRTEAMLRAMDRLVADGKVLAIACSNFPAWLLTRSMWIADIRNLARFEAVQSVYSPLLQDISRELIPAARQAGVSVIGYSPLASGALLGSRLKGDAPINAVKRGIYLEGARAEALARLRQVAQQHAGNLGGERPAAIALALQWTLANGADAVVFGARSPEQAEETIAAAAAPLPADAAEQYAQAAAQWRARAPLMYPPPPGGSIITTPPPTAE